MIVSSSCVEERKKEQQVLRKLMGYSIVFSLLLHAGIIAASMSGLFDGTPELADDAIDFIVLEEPEPEPEKIEKIEKDIPPEKIEPEEVPPPVEPQQLAETLPPEPLPEPEPVIAATEPPISRPSTVAKSSLSSMLAAVDTESAISEELNSSEPTPLSPITPNSRLQPRLDTAQLTSPVESPQPVAARTSPRNSLSGLRSWDTSAVAPPSPTAAGAGTGRNLLNGLASSFDGSEAGTIQSQNSSGSSLTALRSPLQNPNYASSRPPKPTARRSSRRSSRGGKLSCTRNCRPKYPSRLRERNLEGTIVVRIEVGRNGRASNPEIVESSGYPELDEEAIKDVMKMRFTRPEEGSRIIKTRITYKIEN
ncbi:MAG: TonB family protein [Hormoscilla sp. GUM202]|nr:TonB family protein [Hormoscilla sp. GUM202]